MSGKSDKLKQLLSEDGLKTVTAALREFNTEASIARSFGYTPEYFSTLKTQHPTLDEAVKEGREMQNQFCVNKLYHRMQDDDNAGAQLGAIKFYTKTQLGWSEKDAVAEEVGKIITGITMKTIEGKDPSKFQGLMEDNDDA